MPHTGAAAAAAASAASASVVLSPDEEEDEEAVEREERFRVYKETPGFPGPALREEEEDASEAAAATPLTVLEAPFVTTPTARELPTKEER